MAVFQGGNASGNKNFRAGGPDITTHLILELIKCAPHRGSAGSQTAPGTRLPALRARLLAHFGRGRRLP